MRIYLDGYEANVPQRLGSSQIAFELIKTFEKQDKKNEYTIFLPDSPLEDLPKERVGWKYKILRPKSFWTQVALPIALFMGAKHDLIFSPTHYIPRFSPIKRIATIFDLSFLHFPEMFEAADLWKLRNWTRFSVQNADHIITISNFSKKDILKNYGVEDKKITVAYPGYDEEVFRIKNKELRIKVIQKKYKIGDNYLIYIGTIQPRKNLTRLIEAFSRVILSDERRISLKLVIVGKTEGEGRQGWMYQDILDAPKKFGIEDRVKFTGFVPTQDLPHLLSGAYAFVLPSLWEGFGIPVLEAMACGVPVIVSNVSSLPEVVGSAGILVNPYSVDQIEQAIRTVVSDKKLWEKYSKAGIEQAKKFSWEKMARTVLGVFDRV